MSARSLGELIERASHPPLRLHRSAVLEDEPLVFYIFRIPGRQELCLSLSKPGADVVTDVDVSASFYLLRFDEQVPSNKFTLLRFNPPSGGMKEVAMIDDPPGQVDVFEHGYGSIESSYWSLKDQQPTTIKSSFACPISSSAASLSFTTPWVGTANMVASKIGNALKCYHTVPHVEGDLSRPRVQISELRFNFSMPRMSASGQATSKRSSIALQIRKSPALTELNAKRRSMLGSSSDSIDSMSSVQDRGHVADAHHKSDHEFRHPSFYVPLSHNKNSTYCQVPSGNSNTSRGMPATSAKGLDQVPEERSTTESGDPEAAISNNASDAALSAELGVSEIDTSSAVASSTSPLTGRTNGRILGPRPLPPTGIRTPIVGEEVVTRAVTTGVPMTKKSHVHAEPQHAEKDVARTRQPSIVAQPRMHSVVSGTPVVSSDSGNQRTSTIKRKPVRSATSDSTESQPTPTAGKEKIPLPFGADSKGPLNRHPALTPNPEHSTEQELPPPPYMSRQNTLETPQHMDPSMAAPPPLPERAPALPPRPEVAPQEHLDLSLGREKLGGGFDGEQAKLGKLIVEPEGQKMLDLIVAANLLAFRRAFVAANVMGK